MKPTMNYIALYLKKIKAEILDIQAIENYQSRDGFQLLEKEEFEKMIEFFKEFPEDFGNIIPIMTDNNSNYLCLYTNGMHKNRICYLSHEEHDLTPRFKSLKSLIETIERNPECWDFNDLDKSIYDEIL